MSKPYEELLDAIRADREKLGRPNRPRASSTDIATLIAQVQRKFDHELPKQYLEFLRLSDGLNYEGLVVYDAKSTDERRTPPNFWQGFVYCNEQWRGNPENRQYLIFGDDSISLHAQDLRDGQFKSMDKIAYERFETYDSFDDMITTALGSLVEDRPAWR